MSHDQGKTWHWTDSTADKKVPPNFAQEQLTDIKRLYKDKPELMRKLSKNIKKINKGK